MTGVQTCALPILEFPAEALKAKKLKEIRLELAYIPSPYREESINFTVSIGAGK